MVLPRGWKFFWRKVCNGNACVLKRSFTASRRIQIFGKRLITFGFTVQNVYIFYRKLKANIFDEMLGLLSEFLVPGNGDHQFSKPGKGNCKHPCKLSTFDTLNNIYTFRTVNPKVISRFSKFWILRKAVTLLFKTHAVPLHTFRQKNFQPRGSTPRPPTGSRITNL